MRFKPADPSNPGAAPAAAAGAPAAEARKAAAQNPASQSAPALHVDASAAPGGAARDGTGGGGHPFRSNTAMLGGELQNTVNNQRRRGSYVCEHAADTSRAAAQFTMRRTMSVRPPAGQDQQGMEGSGWGSWSPGQPISPRPEKKKSDTAAELLSAAQVEQYHRLLEGLQHIKGLHDCVDHPCGNIYWDFRINRCMPGRVWDNEMPPEVRAQVDRNFTPEEIKMCEESINLHGAPARTDEDTASRALFIIGPAAAGKSAVRSKTEELMQIKLSDYVEIDGDEFRTNHQGWMSVLKGDRTRGYKDALNVLLPYTRELKKRVRQEAIAQRKHLIIPSTASDLAKLEKEVDSVRDVGYRVDVIGLVVSYREARARALNRAHENGRWNDGTIKKWESAMQGIIWAMNPEISDMCVIFDNQNFNEPTAIYTRTFAPNFVDLVVDKYREQDKEYAERVAQLHKSQGKDKPKKKDGK